VALFEPIFDALNAAEVRYVVVGGVVFDVGGTPVRVASIQDPITLKRQAGRPQDEADIAALRELDELGGEP
jgi:hypothetical protein